MAVPSIKLIVVNPVIITIQLNENRINIRSNHGAALTLDCPACVQLKVGVKNLEELILSWPIVHTAFTAAMFAQRIFALTINVVIPAIA